MNKPMKCAVYNCNEQATSPHAGITLYYCDKHNKDRGISTVIQQRPALSIFSDCTPLLDSKAADYANSDNYHSNFIVSQYFIDLFPSPYQSYAALIGTKIARLSVLLNKGDSPRHESVKDSFIDVINYIALMYERYEQERSKSD